MRRKRFDVRPGEVDIEEKEEDSKASYGWLLIKKKGGLGFSEDAEREG